MDEKLSTQAHVNLENEDYHYETSYTSHNVTAKLNEATSSLYCYQQSAANLSGINNTTIMTGGGGGGGSGSGCTTATAAAAAVANIGGVSVVSTEYGSIFKRSTNISKSSAANNDKILQNDTSYCCCFGNDQNDIRDDNVATFWSALLANLGICTLLLGYIFIGSFVFLTIENAERGIEKRDNSHTNVAHHISWGEAQTTQMSAMQNQQQQQQKQLPSYEQLQQQLRISTLEAATTESTQAGHIDAMNMNNNNNSISAIGSEVSNVAADSANADYESKTLNLEETEFEDAERQRTVENIWDITVSLNILYKENWTKLAALEIAKYQDQLVKRLVMDLKLSNSNTNSVASKPASTTAITDKRNMVKMEQNHNHYHRQYAMQRHAPFNRYSYFHKGAGEREFEWNFATAFLYSLTVISTVGYGTIMPNTVLGRMITIGYATFGIPLMLLYLSSVGGSLASITRDFCMRTHICCGTCHRKSYLNLYSSRLGSKNKSQQQHQQNEADSNFALKLKQFWPTAMRHHHQTQQQHLSYCYVRPPATTSLMSAVGGDASDTVSRNSSLADPQRNSSSLQNPWGWSLVAPIVMCVAFLITYVGIGSIIISLFEHWSLIDGIYFCFMTLTTIGFGDLLPGTYRANSPLSMTSVTSNFIIWFCAIYILCGLTFTSMCVNLLHEEILLRMRVVVKFKKVAAKSEPGKECASYYGDTRTSP